jgi:hypothetical protein
MKNLFKVGDKIRIIGIKNGVDRMYYNQHDVGVVILVRSDDYEVDFRGQGNKIVKSDGRWYVPEADMEFFDTHRRSKYVSTQSEEEALICQQLLG